MNTLVVIADPVPLDAAVRAIPPSGDVHLLAVGRAIPLAADLRRAIGPRLHALSAVDLMRDAVPVARAKFVRFAAEWPARPAVFGGDFLQAFLRDGCPAWWFTDLSQKNAGTRPTFARLCELEALRIVLARATYERAILVVDDRDHANVLAQACAQARVPAATAWRPATVDGESVPRLLLGRVKRWWLDACATRLARRHALPATVDVDPSRRLIAFHTWFPSQWRSWRGASRDRYFVDVPDLLRRSAAAQPFYACVIPAPEAAALRSGVRAAATRAREEPNAFVFLERWSSVRDVCRLYADVRPALKDRWLQAVDRRFRRSFDWDGIDVFPLARHDLAASLVRDLPYYELLALRLRRMVAGLRPADVVTPLETYAYGRAVAWGVHAAHAGARVVGYQHSPVNANQLMYAFTPGEAARMPLPDVWLLHGGDARRMLRQSGIADERLIVTGAPRFDDLTEFRRRRSEHASALRRQWNVGAGTRLVVVAGVIWPEITRALLQTCMQALADRPDTLVLIKPHPLHAVTENDLREAAGSRARFAVTTEDLNVLQAAADVMVGAFGTSDAEAIAIGCPVVRVLLTNFDLSPTSDEPGATVEVAGPDELRRAIDAVLAGAAPPPRTAEFIERVFFRLDGRSAERVVAAIEAGGGSRAAVPA